MEGPLALLWAHKNHLQELRVILLFLVREGGARDTFLKENACTTWRQIGEGRVESFSCNLLFLNCLLFKIICMPKWNIQGWHILISFTPKCQVHNSPKHGILNQLSQSTVLKRWFQKGSGSWDCYPWKGGKKIKNRGRKHKRQTLSVLVLPQLTLVQANHHCPSASR